MFAPKRRNLRVLGPGSPVPARAACLLALTALCAPALAVQVVQPVAAAAAESTLRPEDLRVFKVGYRLALAGGAYCRPDFPLTGLLLHHLPEYEAADRPGFIAQGLGKGPGVLSVVEGSPAALAGIRAGDVLLSVNGRAFASPLAMAAQKDRKTWRAMIQRSESQFEDQLRAGPAEILLLREGRTEAVRLAPLKGCPLRIRLARSRQNNAFADGAYVVMTTSLLDFLESDDELAVVIGHELAHNFLGHKERLEQQDVPRGALRGFGKNAARVRVTEEEADRLSIRLASAAGYDAAAAIPFWRRFSNKFDWMPQLFRTHPGERSRERLVTEELAKLGSRPPG